MRRAAMASVGVSLFLVAIKAFAYFASHSVAMLASLADSALDLFTAGLNFFAIQEALTPADREHRFGHGKAEPLAGLAQGAFITASALFLVIQAVQRLISPQPIEHGLEALVVMLVAIVAAIGLILYERSVIKRTGSLAISADQTHYIGDLATNFGVVIAILLAGLGWVLADPIIALLVAAVLVGSAWLVFRRCLDQLMDHEWPEARRPICIRASSMTDSACRSCSGMSASIGLEAGTGIVTSTWMPRLRRAAMRAAVAITSGTYPRSSKATSTDSYSASVSVAGRGITTLAVVVRSRP